MRARRARGKRAGDGRGRADGRKRRTVFARLVRTVSASFESQRRGGNRPLHRRFGKKAVVSVRQRARERLPRLRASAPYFQNTVFGCGQAVFRRQSARLLRARLDGGSAFDHHRKPPFLAYHLLHSGRHALFRPFNGYGHGIHHKQSFRTR